MAEDFRPHDYQKIGIQHVLANPACGLFLDMGLGKTVITLTAINELMFDRYEISKVLVIAPKRVARDTWPAEIEKWNHTKHLRYSRVLGSSPKPRLRALEKPADIYLINRENVIWLVDLYQEKWPFDMIVIDELSSFKSTSAKRFRELRKVRPLANRVVGLTGTPAPKGLIDLWPQVYLLDRGERLGKTVTSYRNRYFYPGRRNGYVVYDWALKEGAEEAIYEKIGDICISMKSEDWLELPERLDRNIEIELPDKARKQYKRLERDLLLPHADGDITAGSAGILSNKLLQLANGAVYDENGNVREIHDAKLDALEDLVESANGKPVLVAYAYKHDRARIKERFPEARILDTDKDMSDWNKGEIPIALAHPASIGHGLNLQQGGNILIWFGLTWSLELYQQMVKRLHRQGQEKSVLVYHLIVKGTVDEDVMRTISRRDADQDALLEAIKARIDEYRKVG